MTRRRKHSHPDWPFNIPDDVPARYRPAAGKLAHSLRGGEEKRFHDALFIAVHDCERAWAYNWPAHAMRKEARKITSTWEVAQNAADKLANYFEQHPLLEGFYPLHLASKKAG